MIQSTFNDIPPREFFPTPGRVFTEGDVVSGGPPITTTSEVTFNGGTPAIIDVVFTTDWAEI